MFWFLHRIVLLSRTRSSQLSKIHFRVSGHLQLVLVQAKIFSLETLCFDLPPGKMTGHLYNLTVSVYQRHERESCVLCVYSSLCVFFVRHEVVLHGLRLDWYRTWNARSWYVALKQINPCGWLLCLITLDQRSCPQTFFKSPCLKASSIFAADCSMITVIALEYFYLRIQLPCFHAWSLSLHSSNLTFAPNCHAFMHSRITIFRA